MSAHIITGSMFEHRLDGYVNPVNCVGVSGAGLALEFKRRFPQAVKEYERSCKHGGVQPGAVKVCKGAPRVICFPTKRHWRDASRLEDIERGLLDLVDAASFYGIKTIGVPALGCGLGGLRWDDVKPLIVAAAERSGADWYISPPQEVTS